ncbi:protein TALPID3-like isoform X1 [Lates japonicus]|uniref:Protein TALPID3-like isoform X1 n=1 Tax=Lates japonicus TaxID=270547 RepID=A0AAD3NBP9_LATJO|nr:protein TALPID3-like isoform X1 [Lates japonicus]
MCVCVSEEEVVCSLSAGAAGHGLTISVKWTGQRSRLLTLLTKMEQESHNEERDQLEGSWGRGNQDQGEECRGGDRHRTTNLPRPQDPRSSSRSTAAGRGQTSSPGQISQCRRVRGQFEVTNQGSDTGDLMAEPPGTLTSDPD